MAFLVLVSLIFISLCNLQSVIAKSCFFADPTLYSITHDVNSHFLHGFSPVSSWSSLSPGLHDELVGQAFKTIASKLSKTNVKAFKQLEVLNQTFSHAPYNALQCQLACLLHPKCKFFSILKEDMFLEQSNSTTFLEQGCYLHDAEPRDGHFDPIKDTAHVIVGRRLCPEFDFEDWDGDGVSNLVDGCPLLEFQQDHSCPCSVLATYPPDSVCDWKQAAGGCLIPLLDFRKTHAAVKADYLTSTPEECQNRCQETTGCKYFSFNFVDGCFFHSGPLPATIGHLGLPREPQKGSVSGVALCGDMPPLSRPPAGPECLRRATRFKGRQIWEPLLLSSMDLCSALCSHTRACIAWTFEELSNTHNNLINSNIMTTTMTTPMAPGLCVLVNALFNEETVFSKRVFASPRNACGSCSLDSDGDGVFDCQDYCPYDRYKVFPGLCGCSRLENLPLCTSISAEQRLLLISKSNQRKLISTATDSSTSVHTSSITTENVKQSSREDCFHVAQQYVADGTTLKAISNYNPMTSWLHPDGSLDSDSDRLPMLPTECQRMCQYTGNCIAWNFDIAQTFGCTLFSSKHQNAEAPTAPANASVVCGPKFCSGSCFDGIKNQDEEMIDCGGTICAPCGTLCHDNKLNQNEDDIDCGGVCKQCSCLRNNGGCSHYCIPFNNQPKCFCKAGFPLSQDGRTCMEINQCTDRIPVPCLPFPCRNLKGTFECVCNEGWGLTANNAYCVPPVRGACWAKNKLIDAPIFNRLLSPVKPTAGILVPKSAQACREACSNEVSCFVWIFAEDNIDDNTDATIARGCHLRGLGSGSETTLKGVISGFKFGSPSDESCHSVSNYPLSPLPSLVSIDVIQLNPLEIAMAQKKEFLEKDIQSIFGISLMLAFHLPQEAVSLMAEIVKVELIQINKNLDQATTTTTTPTVLSDVFKIPTEFNVSTGLLFGVIPGTTTVPQLIPTVNTILLNEQKKKNGSLKTESLRQKPVGSIQQSSWRRLVIEDEEKHNNLKKNSILPIASLDMKVSKELLRYPFAQCTVTKQSHGSYQCLLKVWGIPPDTDLMLSTRICYSNSPVCGDEFKTPIFKIPQLDITPYPLKLNIGETTLTRDEKTVKFQSLNIQWNAKILTKIQRDTLKTFQDSIESMQIIGNSVSSSSSVFQNNDNPPFKMYIRSHFDEEADNWNELPFNKDLKQLFNDQSNTAFSLLSPNDTTNCDSTTNEYIIQLLLKFTQPRCIQSLKLIWKDALSPQIVQVKEQLNNNDQWINRQNGQFETKSCTLLDRTDIFNLRPDNSMTTMQQTTGLQITVGRPCQSPFNKLSSNCSIPYYMLRQINLQECQNVKRTWILFGPQYPKPSKYVKHEEFNISRTLLVNDNVTKNDPLLSEWKIELPSSNEFGSMIDFEVDVIPSSLRQYITIGESGEKLRVKLKDQTHGISKIPSLGLLAGSILLPIFLFLMCLGIGIYWYLTYRQKNRKILIKKNLNNGSVSTALLPCSSFNKMMKNKELMINEKEGSPLLQTVEATSHHTPQTKPSVTENEDVMDVISPGGTLNSIMNMFSRMLSSIPEEDHQSEAGESSRGLTHTASRFWNSIYSNESTKSNNSSQEIKDPLDKESKERMKKLPAWITNSYFSRPAA